MINKAGHRLGTAEIESALVVRSATRVFLCFPPNELTKTHDACAEAAVVSVPDDVKGYA